MYAKFLREAMAGDGSSNVVGRSLLIDNLHIAAVDPMCTDGKWAFDYDCHTADDWQYSCKACRFFGPLLIYF